jgi:cobalt-zinc-cadmium efflux system protein
MIGVAVIGIALNGFSFLRLKSGESESEKVLSWHLLEDVFGWLIVLIGSVVIYFTRYYIIDPIMILG